MAVKAAASAALVLALTAMGSQTRLSAMPDQHRVMHGHGLDRETVLGNLHAIENERLGGISHGPVARMFMRKPPLDPDVADTAPADSILTPYDHERAIAYLRLLD